MPLHIYAEYDKRLGAYKTEYVLERDYGLHISVGRVYRLMESMQLPKMSTTKPAIIFAKYYEIKTNYLEQNFEQIDELNIVQSFSKKCYPFDNDVAEAFFKYLKKEDTNRRTFSSFSELKLSVFEYIEGFYNSKRPHSSIGYLTPNEKKLQFYSRN